MTKPSDNYATRLAIAVADLLSGQIINTSTTAGRSTVEAAVITAVKTVKPKTEE